ncbi:nucleotide-diphospho-sugar transferase [Delitschia confertaspora ATCC 74209]|uniref:Nucleotide-diphospho-sugar transferase n=1 Tax=Delitschia confertaspora ATCC 74209 TaxID=1513339 RepID=A0A9P4MYG2_9PLEO|nr:nucleotide-diphospho-sugar transferase [Delitschia confertaspora ATCC 74209]
MSSPSNSNPQNTNAYATLLTRPSYLAGTVILAYTLHKHSPTTPLIIFYTPSTLPQNCISALGTESQYSNCVLRPVSHLKVPTPTSGEDSRKNSSKLIAERFADTWTKLRVFEAYDMKEKFEKICFLDSDMLIRRDPSPIVFSTPLPGEDWTLATHVCVCNLDSDPWAPADWKRENCAYTGLTHPSCVENPPPVSSTPPTHALFNSGCFVFQPSPALADKVMRTFESTPPETLSWYLFPDQDFLNQVFKGKWRALPYTVNALKTWRYWHKEMWRDGEVRVCHFIVDKPWAAELPEDQSVGVGYKGRDGVTHRWWWDQFRNWDDERRGEGIGKKELEELLNTVWSFTACGNGRDELKAIGSQAQGFAENRGKNGSKGEEKKEDDKQEVQNTRSDEAPHHGNDNDPSIIDEPFGPVLRPRMLGERGHGPVVRFPVSDKSKEG